MRVARWLDRRQAELDPQIDDGKAGAAHVDHAEQKVRRMRQLGDRPHVENFADDCGYRCRNFPVEPERQILRCFGHAELR